MKITFNVTQEHGHILTIYAAATHYPIDHTIRTVDITEITFGGVDVTNYISACQSDKWDELMELATAKLKSLNNEPA